MLSFGRNCRIVLTSCSQSCRSSTVSDEFISPATNLSPKSWRVKAPAWSRIQVGLMNTRTTIHTHSPWRTHYRALTTSAHDNNHYIDIWHRNKETVCQMSTISWTSDMPFCRYWFRGGSAVQHEPWGGDDVGAAEGAASSGNGGFAAPARKQGSLYISWC